MLQTRFIEISSRTTEAKPALPQTPIESCTFTFNDERYLMAGHESNRVLFDRSNYRTTIISDELSDFFRSCQDRGRTLAEVSRHPKMSASAVDSMIRLKILLAQQVEPTTFNTSPAI